MPTPRDAGTARPSTDGESGEPGSPCRICGHAGARDQADLDLTVHLYLCGQLSARRIAVHTGLGRRRVTEILRAAGVELPPRGAGRPRPAPAGAPAPPSPARLRALYVDDRLTARAVGEIVGLSERRVVDWLHRYGIPVRTRGGRTREERRAIPARTLHRLYVGAQMTADAIGRRTGVSHQIVLRSAHDLGLPVRNGGVVSGDAEIELINALYTDPQVAAALRRHGIPYVPPGGPIWVRFPEPIPLDAELVRALYVGCGLATTHIELLTGRPAACIRRDLRNAGVTPRPSGGRSPFLRRFHAARARRAAALSGSQPF